MKGTGGRLEDGRRDAILNETTTHTVLHPYCGCEPTRTTTRRRMAAGGASGPAQGCCELRLCWRSSAACSSMVSKSCERLTRRTYSRWTTYMRGRSAGGAGVVRASSCTRPAVIRIRRRPRMAGQTRRAAVGDVAPSAAARVNTACCHVRRLREGHPRVAEVRVRPCGIPIGAPKGRRDGRRLAVRVGEQMKRQRK